ncbi:recombinase RecQ [Flavilitoribacter nigricans DSM 23189 = NBRC 102662]|uniref:ATP-dependent DNA helicase RecQ n=2 Tax=Flavilitoribacter TaxID=2762562 RepID=A0A2D0NA82_FLAN2|nr:recombinase RecQ [Flavilitoribacter nigricans DSM 23189 = NBRC 102662]
MTPLEVLQLYWGYDSFRPLQEDIIQSVLDGQDTLALLPTGGGKSICFQVPALVQDGMCLVVSPLIALMKDQVENLKKREIAAEAIYSGMHYRDIDRILDNAVYGGVKFLYVSPERLTTEIMQERLKKMPVRLLAIDEAHCVSQWGYDFRPPYLQIAETRELLSDKVPVLALTATATPPVVKDIQEKLAFKKGRVLQKSFARENLAYVVLQEEGKEKKLVEILQKTPGTAVVYVRSRRRTKELATWLRKHRIHADYYHAGLLQDTRTAKQEAWMNNKIRVMVSTNAFGMGIDKADVRTVVHLDLPDSLEAYFQEAGRAGRDGKKAFAVLLYNQSDRHRLERHFETAFPEMSELRRVYRALGSYFQLAVGGGQGDSFNFDIVDFARTYQLDLMITYSCLQMLEQAGWILLTDAVFVPSSLRIKVSKDELYDYQLRNPKMERILKTILRTYQGAMQYDIHLREKQLARFLAMPQQQLQQALGHLQKAGIINYSPQREDPQLIFLQERVDADNLAIDQALYNFRKQRHRDRIQSAIRYAETPVCRSQQLLAYFGEEDAPKCGKCDVCLGRTKAEVSTDDFERYKEKIQRLLKREQLSMSQLIESFPPKRENQVLRSLEYLLDEGFVEKVGELIRWKE